MADNKPKYTDDPETLRQRYERIASTLRTDRTSFESHWRDLADHIMPRRIRFFTSDRNKGDRRNLKIIDSTATFAANTLSSGMHAGLTSPSRPWLKLTTDDPELAELKPVKQWLSTVSNRMLAVFAQSNLYDALPTAYGDAGVFGTSCISVMEHQRDVIRCFVHPVGSYWLGVSADGIADTLVREYRATVRQVVNQFLRDPDDRSKIDWSRASRALRTLFDEGNYETEIDICSIVMPNEEYDSDRLSARYMPWTSTWFEKGQDDNTFLKQSGFNECPFLAPRWNVIEGDAYGTNCPGMTVLGDVRQLQIMEKRKAQAVEKSVNPPLQGPTSVRNQKVSLIAGDLSYVDENDRQKGLRPIHEIRMSVADLREDINDTRYRVRRGFYEDLFLMMATQDQAQPITAREVAERHEEKMLALGPVLERTNDELLDPLVDRTYAIMERRGLIPEPPNELKGQRLVVEYVSVLAQAQKLVGVVGLDRLMQTTLSIAEVFPQVRAKINVFEVINDYGDMLGVNPKVIVDDDEAQQTIDAQQQQAAQMQQQEAQAQAAQSAQRLSQAKLEDDSALRRLVEGVTQQ